MALSAEEMRQAVRGGRGLCECGNLLPRYKGVGRPRKQCVTCSPPKPGRKVFRAVSGENRARHAARSAAARATARIVPDIYAEQYAIECTKRGVRP